MGNGASYQPLSHKEIGKLQKDFPLTNEGIVFFHTHYHRLLAGIQASGADKPRQIQQDEELAFKTWILEKCFEALFPEMAQVTFREYLTTLFSWRGQTVEERLEFYFDLLDYNGDGLVTPSDLSIFIQEATDYRFQVGDSIRTRDDERIREGKVAYLGKTEFAKGNWAGIILDTPSGKNNGTVEGVTYFECKDNFGVFVPVQMLELDTHYKQGKLIVEQFGAKDSLSKAQFLAKCLGDKWLQTRLMHDPIKAEYLVSH
ncbi:CAP-GLY domain-containing linker protein 1 [Kappamyces sp. JEL0680]|nr:CAP-GLY domain-containing linker protein 1 [Kappamyces sp. JEL0680]